MLSSRLATLRISFCTPLWSQTCCHFLRIHHKRTECTYCSHSHSRTLEFVLCMVPGPFLRNTPHSTLSFSLRCRVERQRSSRKSNASLTVTSLPVTSK
uniref:Putative secreted protein n=1 Tax=Ixodes ricinus TaxID=34613 RepID=A0A6B0U4V8_IXORI